MGNGILFGQKRLKQFLSIPKAVRCLQSVRNCPQVYRVSQELRSLFRDLIPEPILSQKLHIQMGPIRKVSGVMSFQGTVNKLERKVEHCAFIELCCQMFEVSSVCLDAFSDSYDQRTCNLAY